MHSKRKEGKKSHEADLVPSVQPQSGSHYVTQQQISAEGATAKVAIVTNR